eukprot:1158100-Pelagomonas_calceolata.AAC.6
MARHGAFFGLQNSQLFAFCCHAVAKAWAPGPRGGGASAQCKREGSHLEAAHPRAAGRWEEKTAPATWPHAFKEGV